MSPLRLIGLRTLLVLSLLGVSQPAGGESPRRRVAALDVRQAGSAGWASVEGLSSVIASSAARRTDLEVISGADIRAMVGVEEQKALLGCVDSNCLAEIGGALGADLLLISEISRLGGRWILSVSLVDQRNARAVSRTTRKAEQEDQILLQADEAIAEVLAWIPLGPSRSRPGTSLLRARVIGTGAGGLVSLAGGALFAAAHVAAADPVTRAEAEGIRTRAGFGLGMMLGGAAIAAGSWFLLDP